MKSKLFGRYELCHKLATGGMAELFLAIQRGRSGFLRAVVIKRLFRHLADDARVLQLFKNEALLLGSLDHPGLPQVYEFGAAEGQWYMAMEHVRGHSVAQVLEASAEAGIFIPLPVACAIVIQAADALGYAHQFRNPRSGIAEVVHRDVTPDNLMVTETGHIKVLDFGVAQTAEGTGTHSGVVTGTYAYMPPEQVHGRKLDHRVDVYALGVILYELATNSRLFMGTDLEVMTAVVEREVPPPSARRPEIPAALQDIIMRTLEKERMRRLAGASELALGLESLALNAGWLLGSHVIRDHLRAISSKLSRSTEFDLPHMDIGTALSAGRDVELLSSHGALEHFDDDSMLEDIRMLAEPLGGAEVGPQGGQALEFGPDALSGDLGEARAGEGSARPRSARGGAPKPSK